MEPMNTELPQNPITPVEEVARSSLSPSVMQPSLLMASSSGDCEALKILLNWGDSPVRPAAVAPQVVVDVHDGDTFDANDVPNGSLVVQPTSADTVEEGPDQPNDASNESLASQEVTDQPAGNATDGILTLQQASTTDAGTDQLGNNTDGQSDMQQTPPEAVQQGVDQPAVPPSESILGGVTPQGDTALHVVAKSGPSGDNFLDCAYVIYNKAKHLLDATNEMGDTPLHCAARAGNYGMVSCLVDSAKREADGSEKLKTLLRKQNKRGETVLHEAIRSGNEDIVSLLLTEDPELARVPSVGTSPLYLAILLREFSTARKLYEEDNQLSYSGPDGQNALHAAAIRNKEMVKKLLESNEGLTTQGDENGSTPLHFAASLPFPTGRYYRKFHNRFPWIRVFWDPNTLSSLLSANVAPVYQADNHGMFPIHVAASVGVQETVAYFLRKFPDTAGLRDARGRTFLHVAVENKRSHIVSFACRNRSLAWILNMQDNDGNTALHLAVQSGKLRMFCALFGNREVHLNLTNDKRQTPRDIARYKIPPEMHYAQNSEVRIKRALEFAGARNGVYRHDHFEGNYKDMHQLKSDDESKESEKVKDSTQTLCIGSVLIATVTFGATFALPGGYRADDHPNGGTPTLAGRWVFDAFMMANTLAFILSSIATVGLMYSGSPMVNLASRRFYLGTSVYFMTTSITSLTAAFALGEYMVLAPVAHKTAVAICVMSSLVLLWRKMEFWLKMILLVPSLCIRRGIIWALQDLASVVLGNMLLEFWPLILAFGWAAHGRDHPVLRMEPPVQPPTPFA